MSRSLLTVALLFAAAGCKEDAPKRGPALTPLTANQLKALAPACELRAVKGAKNGASEVRICTGRQAQMTLHLDDQRHLVQLEVGLWAASLEEAKLLLEQTLRGVVGPAALTAMSSRLVNAKSDPVTADGVRVNAFRTQAPNENPRYTVDLAW